MIFLNNNKFWKNNYKKNSHKKYSEIKMKMIIITVMKRKAKNFNQNKFFKKIQIIK